MERLPDITNWQQGVLCYVDRFDIDILSENIRETMIDIVIATTLPVLLGWDKYNKADSCLQKLTCAKHDVSRFNLVSFDKLCFTDLQRPRCLRGTECKTWWRHQMETFSALLAICAGNSPVTGEFHAQRPGTRSFDVFFDLRLNTRLNKQSWGWWFETLSRPLWRHCNGNFIKVVWF